MNDIYIYIYLFIYFKSILNMLSFPKMSIWLRWEEAKNKSIVQNIIFFENFFSGKEIRKV